SRRPQMFRTVSRARTSAVVALALLACAATPSRSQSITSFEPDTTRRRHADVAPSGTVDLPVWVASDAAYYAPYVPTVSGDRAGRGLTWTGIAVLWPADRWRRWMELGYQHLNLQRTRYDSFPTPFSPSAFVQRQPIVDQVIYRTGIDRIAGTPEHPWAFVG